MKINTKQLLAYVKHNYVVRSKCNVIQSVPHISYCLLQSELMLKGTIEINKLHQFFQ